MNNLIIRSLPIAALIVDVLIIADIISDFVRKHKESKNKETSPTAEEAPAAEV